MMNILNAIKLYPLDKLNKCCENNCCAELDDIKERIVLKGEPLMRHILGKQNMVCDFFVFTSDSEFVIMLVELKSKNPNLNKVVTKLTNSFSVADLILKEHNYQKKYRILPVLLAKSYRQETIQQPHSA